ncbi:MAG TPA: sulfatase-like hydrolase/transferase [Chthoniobacterales bacterium]|nr:sulfatase-like hydrolase/transferase [Chthoniobacterales bacterium]
MRDLPGFTADRTISREQRCQYLALLVAVGGLIALSLMLVQVRGGFAYPSLFFLFAKLFQIQFGLLGGTVLAGLLYLLPRSRLSWFVRSLLLAVYYLLFVWVLVWGLVQRAFGIELTLGTIRELFTSRAQLAAVGLGPLEWGLAIGVTFVIVCALTVQSRRLEYRVEARLQKRVCLVLLGSFLVVHGVVRTYFVYHLNRNHHVVLAYDDCAPFPLRSEQLVPGLRLDRIALPNLESESRTAQYLDYLRTHPMPMIPRRHNILWINIESLRFDAVDEQVMPRLTAKRDRFQIRLDRQHWSGGNATPWGVFSMLTGLSGYHLKDFQWARMNDPFLSLLSKNGYRLRVANKDHIDAAGLAWLFPAGTVFQSIGVSENEEEDRRTIDRYFKDRSERNAATPAFDFVALNATHLPYAFPAEHAIFQPAPKLTSSHHILRSDGDLEIIRNRYRNGCHFVDQLIGRVLDDLEAQGDLTKTIVVITGDHGEEFQERGQLTHAGVLNDYQARTVLWIHLPDTETKPVVIEVPTVHLDIVPTLLEALGYDEDVLRTQGRSLLGHLEDRRMLSLCEHLSKPPRYRALVTDTYISRWRYTASRYLFSGVQRRDGAAVEGEDWLREARELYATAAEMYEIVPDVSRPAQRFEIQPSAQR